MESRSMMHGDKSSSETLDPGDVVEIVKIKSRDDVITYVQGKEMNYKMFGDYGDVIAYYKNGVEGRPVIHRTVVWIKFNDTTFNYNNSTGRWRGGAYDIPELNVYGLTSIYQIANYSYNSEDLMIDFGSIIDNFANSTFPGGLRMGFKSTPHSGFLTKGDNNVITDQNSLRDSNGNFVEPVKVEWIKGKVKFADETFFDLYLYMIVIIVIIIAIIIIVWFKRRKKKSEVLKYGKDYNGEPPGRHDYTRLENHGKIN
ncbi:MAG: hypothetical protein KAJ51_07400 [Thermoplasmata archaeon]|nr:hypothetical protein [Thermoplasmata archaeon]